MALVLGGCTVLDPRPPATPVSRAGPVQVVPQGGIPALPKPPGFAFGVAEEAGVDRRCLRDVITAPLLTRNGRTFVRHRTVLVGFASHVLSFSDEHPDLLPVDATRPEKGSIASRLAIVRVRGDPAGSGP